MSFFKKLGKTKTSESPSTTETKTKKGKRSFNLQVESRRQEANGAENEELRGVENEKEKEKERRKYKDMSGILLGGTQESRAYPTFLVHYLGRIPTSAEYGREAVEDPVNQLCKLREKQKLQRILLNFNVEGLSCHEVTGPFLKTKKDGFNLHIPLHHITYGVGCAAHPTVFACISKMNDDPQPESQVIVLHAFVCDKPETTQAITYWQLQAYIEAYEDLKRKRILRSRRKQAMDGSSNQQRTDMADVPEEGQTELPNETNRQAGTSKHAIAQNNNTQSHVTVVKNPTSTKGETAISSKGKSSVPTKEDKSLSSKGTSLAPTKGEKHQAKEKSHVTSKEDETLAAKAKSPFPVKERHSGAVRPKPNQLPLTNHSANSPHNVQAVVDVHSVKSLVPRDLDQKQAPALSQSRQDDKRSRASAKKKQSDSPGVAGKGPDVRKNSDVPTGSVSSRASSSSGSGKEGSPLASPSVKTNKTFESRIGELNNLLVMDAEKLKKLMINEHPTLARRIYYRATVDESGVFQQGEGVPVDSNDTTEA